MKIEIHNPTNLPCLDYRTLKDMQGDLKLLTNENYNKLKNVLTTRGFRVPFYVWKDKNEYWTADGHQRLRVFRKEGVTNSAGGYEFPVVFIEAKDLSEAKTMLLEISSQFGTITQEGYDAFTVGLDDNYLKSAISFDALFDEPKSSEEKKPVGNLADRFIVPPFSVLDTRQGYWQDRKRAWIGLGIQSEIGRGENLLKMSDTVLQPDAEKRKGKTLGAVPGNVEANGENGNMNHYRDEKKKGKTLGAIPPNQKDILGKKGTAYATTNAEPDEDKAYTGTSIFDPVLSELAYKWFCPEGGSILDPFAGGSVRGVVAEYLGCNYTGIDLSAAQVEANYEQAKLIVPERRPQWINADSHDYLLEMKKGFDFIFSCPPYHDLEVYSDDPRDISTLLYSEFLKRYQTIILRAVKLLKDNRFACFVVTEIRDDKGYYKNFVADTIAAFISSGMKFYNDIVLVNTVGSLPIRVGRQFGSYRKVGRVHQNVLVFYKGDVKKIPTDFPEFKIDDIMRQDTQFGEMLTMDNLNGEL